MTKRSMLIIEDDPDLQSLIEFTFDREGYITETFGDGAEAWEYLESTSELPDCLVVDLMMPGVDGMEILSRRAESERIQAIPVIILTAWETEETVEKAFDRGADDYITKPFSPNELLVRTRRLLKQ